MTRGAYHDKEGTINFPTMESCTTLVATDSASFTGKNTLPVLFLSIENMITLTCTVKQVLEYQL